MNEYKELDETFSKGNFKLFIDSIVFTKFKSLEENLEINFEYPITAITGPNGSNKSSILRALQGCCPNKTIGDHWFETAVDKINLDSKYFYRYKTPSGTTAEVKQKITEKPGRPKDYWETDKPRTTEGMRPFPNASERKTEDADFMTKSRWKKISMSNVYLDFKATMPSFNILMNFDWRKEAENVEEKKSTIRRRSTKLKKVLDGKTKSYKISGYERILKPLIKLEEKEVHDVNEILGKQYKSISLVKHDLFKAIGYTAKIETQNFNYTEAFAGSGEFAAIMLVLKISRAHKNSLILLDEPETSLHPGAQRNLIKFLVKASQENKHQIIFATHSAEMIRGLPPKAIKSLQIEPFTEKVILPSQNTDFNDAFINLGIPIDQNIIVEDSLAKHFIEIVLKRSNRNLSSTKVNVLKGGHGTIRKMIPSFAESNLDVKIILDGDQRPQYPISKEDLDKTEPKKIMEIFDKLEIPNDSIPKNSNENKNSHAIDSYKKIINWFRRNVGYLPSSCSPDKLLELMDSGESVENILSGSFDNKKDYWQQKTSEMLGTDEIKSEEILTLQKAAIRKIFEEKKYEEIFKEIEKILVD